MKYIVEWMENRTSAKGNKYIRATLKDEGGAEFTDVAIFDKFPDFANIISGSTLEGNLVSKDYQGKTSYTLNSPNSAPTGGFGGAGGVKMMEKKQEGIKRSQEHKDLSVMTSATIRDAVLIAIEEQKSAPTFDANIFRGRIKFWRKWLQDNWELEAF